MAEVKLEHVSKTYDQTRIIDDLSLTVQDREFIVLVGPSGCGKSTLLRMIAGLESLSEGELHIGERLVTHVPPKDRDIAMVFQNYALYPHMSVYDNMAFGLKMRKTPKATIESKVREAAKILDLEHLLQRKPKQLSGGQRQRVALGRAIVRNPKVFLMDEPLSNLDAKLRVQMRREIAGLHQRLNATTIYVTHDQVEAMTMGDRIVILNKGRIQQVDTPLRVYHEPANMFVAGFVGQMNFFKGQLDSNGFHLADGPSLPLPEHFRPAVPEGGGLEVILGLRPEQILPANTDKGNGWRSTITPSRVEMTGNEQTLAFTLGAQNALASWPSEVPTQANTLCEISLQLDKAYLFNPTTETRLI